MVDHIDNALIRRGATKDRKMRLATNGSGAAYAAMAAVFAESVKLWDAEPLRTGKHPRSHYPSRRKNRQKSKAAKKARRINRRK